MLKIHQQWYFLNLAKIKIIALFAATYIHFFKAVFLTGILYGGTKVHSHKSSGQTQLWARHAKVAKSSMC
jgi:hypothetical protein